LTHIYCIAIQHGDIITIKNRKNGAFLHSHPHNYPLRYKDGRISSAGQQVTAYGHEDENNHWIVWLACPTPEEARYFKPFKPNMSPRAPRSLPRKIQHKDVIQLVHVMTGVVLRTHDVASPLTRTNTEITTLDLSVPENLKDYDDTLFYLDVTDGREATVDKPGTFVKTRDHSFKIVHVPLNVALHSGDGKLPDWGYHQFEVNGEKDHTKNGLSWRAHDIVNRRVEHARAALRPRQLPFMRKFMELQSAMLIHNAGLTEEHPYQSSPSTWPWVLRGISFWTDKESQRQIYLLANPFGWWLSDIALFALPLVMLVDLLTQQRGLDLLGASLRRRIYRSGGYLLGAWALHYFPFFLMGRSLFLHHYLPACILAYMVLGAVYQFALIDDIDAPLALVQTTSASAPAACPVSGKTSFTYGSCPCITTTTTTTAIR
jgi:dolichyl-phosphate-mannose-protein mannosyltransferase